MREGKDCSKRRWMMLFLFIIPIALLTSCQVASHVSTQLNHADPGLTTANLNQGGLVILPVVASGGAEMYRRPFSDTMTRVADSLLTNHMPWNQVQTMLNETGLVNDYTTAIRAYQETGVMNNTLLQKLAEKTGSRYYLYVQLYPPFSEQRINYISDGSGRVRDINELNAYSLVWDAMSGEVVYEGNVSARLSITDTSIFYSRETDMDRVLKVAEALMANLLQ